MNTINVENCKTLLIGRRGENEVTTVAFDFTEWASEFGSGVVDLYVKRFGDDSAYPVVLTVDGTVASWLVTETDTNVAGYGKAEYVYRVDGKIAKSAVFPFFVAEDYFWSLDLDESLQTVVTDDDTTIKVVEVGCSKTTTIKWNEWTKVWWSDRNIVHHHPLRLVLSTRRTECFNHLQTLESLLLALLRTFLTCLSTKLISKVVEVDALEHVLDCLSTHHSDELLWVIVWKLLVFFWQAIYHVPILFLRKELVVENVLLCILSCTSLDDDIALVVDNSIQFLGWQTKEVANLVRKRTEIPDMGNRHNKCDVTCALTTYFLLGYFHTASVADDTFVANTLVLTAMAFIVFGRTKNALAEKSVTLWLIGAVVDGLWLEYLSE